MTNRALFFATCAAVVTIAPLTHAQVSAQTQVSSRRVEVGQPFSIQLTLTSPDSRPEVDDARLAAPPGVRVNGPSVSQQSSVSIVNGRMTQRTGVALSWTVIAARPGTLKLGPPSAMVDGARISGQAVEVEVLPPGQLPQRPRGIDPFNFFDPFGTGRSPFPPGLFNDDAEPEEVVPDYPPELKVDSPSDPIAFLRTTITPERAVIGQQVTLRVYAYGSRGSYQQGYSTEPLHPDFLAYNVELQPRGYEIPLNGQRWIAAKISEVALFPLHAGSLTAGAMKFGFQGRGYKSQTPQLGLIRESNSVVLQVTEPPLAGRPPGYKIGDVGDYDLSAQVEPRSIIAGDAVAVIAELKGTGNVPAKLLIPERKGVDWLDPTTVEKVEPENGIVKGSRTFTYVVRLHEAGTVDLGELTLPYYNAKTRKYEIASAKLGSIEVKPNPKAPSATTPKPEARDSLSGALTLRRTLGPAPAQRSYFTDRAWFWAVLLFAPLAVLGIQAAAWLTRRLRTRLSARGQAPEAVASRALSDAKQAVSANDVGRAASALERALLTAVEGATGIKGRALLRPELKLRLAERGLEAELVNDIALVLDACDNARFTGDTSEATLTNLIKKAESASAKLRGKKYQRRVSAETAEVS